MSFYCRLWEGEDRTSLEMIKFQSAYGDDISLKFIIMLICFISLSFKSKIATLEDSLQMSNDTNASLLTDMNELQAKEQDLSTLASMLEEREKQRMDELTRANKEIECLKIELASAKHQLNQAEGDVILYKKQVADLEDVISGFRNSHRPSDDGDFSLGSHDSSVKVDDAAAVRISTAPSSHTSLFALIKLI